MKRPFLTIARKMIAGLCTVLFLALLNMIVSPGAHAWGDMGHKLIAQIAYRGLTPQAKKNFDLLMQGSTLDKMAVWPDAMRSWQRNPTQTEPIELQGDPQADLFFHDTRNASQANWHFTDQPIGSSDYATATVGTGADDVVHALRRCIAVLQGRPLPGENINAPQALRLLVHYVGDIHQPLHAASGYWLVDTAGNSRLATPIEAPGAASDRGGNGLEFGTGRGEELHAYWDVHLVESLANGTPDAFDSHLSRLQTASQKIGHAPYRLKGDPMEWPAKWASESAALAARAYLPFHAPTNGKIRQNPKTGTKAFFGTIAIPNDYDATFKPLADQQLALAGYRLAAVLNAVLSH